MKRTRYALLGKRIFALVAALALLTGLFALPANAALDTSGFTAEVVRLVNEERAKVGLPALYYGNKALNDAAARRVEEYSSNPSLGHTRPGNKHFSTVFAEYGIAPNTGWSACGENLAVGYLTPEEVVAGWMDSPGHKINIMGGKTDKGVSLNFNCIGVAVCEANGRLYWSQLFITQPGSNNNNNAGGNFFSDILNWIKNIWNSIIGFFTGIFTF